MMKKLKKPIFITLACVLFLGVTPSNAKAENILWPYCLSPSHGKMTYINRMHKCTSCNSYFIHFECATCGAETDRCLSCGEYYNPYA
jgi:predicted RNA-binding Zn-ribbon protein involved in translation (DUF1610 family)